MIPVVIATNGIGLAVRAVDSGAPAMVVAENGLGLPIVVGDIGPPFVVEGLGPISRVTVASIGPYIEGDLPTDAYTPGTYASTAGDIDTVVAEWFVNGDPWDEETALAAGDVVTLRETVTDDADPPNNRQFNYGPVVVTAEPGTGWNDASTWNDAGTWSDAA